MHGSLPGLPTSLIVDNHPPSGSKNYMGVCVWPELALYFINETVYVSPDKVRLEMTEMLWGVSQQNLGYPTLVASCVIRFPGGLSILCSCCSLRLPRGSHTFHHRPGHILLTRSYVMYGGSPACCGSPVWCAGRVLMMTFLATLLGWLSRQAQKQAMDWIVLKPMG